MASQYGWLENPIRRSNASGTFRRFIGLSCDEGVIVQIAVGICGPTRICEDVPLEDVNLWANGLAVDGVDGRIREA
jgi:hypothetical protein